ncbi:MAG: MutS-related protein [Thermomicrobiales bacterium]
MNETYRARRDRFAAERDALTTRWNLLANLRLAAFAALAGFVIWAVQARAWLPLLPAAAALLALVWLIAAHRATGRRRRRAEILHDLNAEALSRRDRDWNALPLRHTYPPDPNHPFAADLDLFGHASVFHLLETVETPMGQARLQDWLLAPASAAEIRLRQAAAAALAPELVWRQDLAALGRSVEGRRIDPDAFLAWAEGDPHLEGRRSFVQLARVTSVGFALAAAAEIGGLVHAPLWILFAGANLLLVFLAGSEVRERLRVVADTYGAISRYADLLAHIEAAPGSDPWTAQVKARLLTHGSPASEQLHRLRKKAAWVVPPSSLVYYGLQAIAAWDLHVLSSLETWRRDSGGRVRDWLAAIGEIEALAALAGLAGDQPDWAFPSVEPGATGLDAKKLGHPLLADATRVANDVALGPSGSYLLITGSNMSGKSTLLRSIGVNVVLANAGGPVCARALTLPPLNLWTSVHVQDSLEQGVSFFMAELRRLKAVVDAADANRPEETRFCFLLDEILQGTNTAERQIAARRVIRHLVDTGAIGAVSTHDLTLADGPELHEVSRPVHLRETMANGAGGLIMSFDYLLRPGIATSTNALAPLEIVFGRA